MKYRLTAKKTRSEIKALNRQHAKYTEWPTIRIIIKPKSY